MPDISFRKMMEIDLEKIIEIERDSFSDPWDQNAFESDLKNELCYPIVALSGEVIAGYSILYIVAGELQIGNFAVAAIFRRQGVGRKMMTEIINIALEKKCDTLYLEVRESNKAAQALYISLGFVSIGRRVSYYRNPRENAILMAKEL